MGINARVTFWARLAGADPIVMSWRVRWQLWSKLADAASRIDGTIPWPPAPAPLLGGGLLGGGHAPTLITGLRGRLGGSWCGFADVAHETLSRNINV